jgi:hypothetical protein
MGRVRHATHILKYAQQRYTTRPSTYGWSATGAQAPIHHKDSFLGSLVVVVIRYLGWRISMVGCYKAIDTSLCGVKKDTSNSQKIQIQIPTC